MATCVLLIHYMHRIVRIGFLERLYVIFHPQNESITVCGVQAYIAIMYLSSNKAADTNYICTTTPSLVVSWSLCSSPWDGLHRAGPPFLPQCPSPRTPHWHCLSVPTSTFGTEQWKKQSHPILHSPNLQPLSNVDTLSTPSILVA